MRKDINFEGARIGRECADAWTEKEPDKPRFLAGAIGPLNKMLSMSPDVNDPGARSVTFDQVYDALGAKDLNAHTWQEETVYKVSLPSNRLEQWAKVESERFTQPVLRLFQPELEVVYEEKNRSLDNAGRIIGTAIDELLYKVHPYGQQPTIGTVDHLKNPSFDYKEALL